MQSLGRLEQKFFNYAQKHNVKQECVTAEHHIAGIAMKIFYFVATVFHIFGLVVCFIAIAHPPLATTMLLILSITFFLTLAHFLYYKYIFKLKSKKSLEQ